MGTTLVINPGSSSKKYALFQNGVQFFSMQFERNGHEYGLCRVRKNSDATCETVAGDIYNNALRAMLDESIAGGLIKNLKEIERVGVRIVATGVYFSTHQVIDHAYEQALGKAEASAPLHIPHIRFEIKQARQELPFSKLIGVSDSALFKSMPAVARQYSIDRKDTEQFGIYRFGYHGLSVSSVVPKFEKLFGGVPKRTIVLHVGSGVSATALLDGRPIDTTMGFSPESGLIMGTRAGDVDAGALLELMRARHLTNMDAHTYINSAGGLLGLCGSADLRQVLERVAKGDDAAKQAVEAFVYHITKTIGAFTAALGGLDAIVMTATAVERNPDLRAKLLAPLGKFESVIINPEVNDALVGKDGVFAAKDSRIRLAVICTNEMGEIAKVVNELNIQPN